MRYWINFYPKGVSGRGDPESYAYASAARVPVSDQGMQIEVEIPDEVSVRVTRKMGGLQ